MRRRHWLLAFLMYLSLDLSSPFVAGAFNFNPDQCVEGCRPRASSSAECIDAFAVPVRRPVVRLALPSPSPVPPLAGGRYTVLEWLADARGELHAFSDPPLLSEDH